VRLEVCTGCHSRAGEKEFPAWLEQLEQKFGIGYFGGEGNGLEVEFVTCLSHCDQGFSVAVEDDVMVLGDTEEFEHLLGRLLRLVAID
jgi:predicted metal-binding protein